MLYIYDINLNDTIRYNAFHGPNGIGFAYKLGVYGVFDPPKPPRVPGWGIDLYTYFK